MISIGTLNSKLGAGYFTEIQFDVVENSYMGSSFGLETSTSGASGTLIARDYQVNMTAAEDKSFVSELPNYMNYAYSVYRVAISMSSLYIPWANRYNYRLGMCNVYSIRNVAFYRDGFINEYYYGEFYASRYEFGFVGVNTKRSDNNHSSYGTGDYVPYPL